MTSKITWGSLVSGGTAYGAINMGANAITFGTGSSTYPLSKIVADGSGGWKIQAYTAAPGAPTAALAGAGAGLLQVGKVYSYKVTFVTAGGETTAGTASGNVTPTAPNGQVALSAIPTGNQFVTSRKIYRTEGDGTTYKLLTTLADNTTATYTDNTADAGLGAAAPTSNTALDNRVTVNNAGQVLVGNGTQALPAYSFSGDSNTGIYTYAGDSLALSTGGAVNAVFSGGIKIGKDGWYTFANTSGADGITDTILSRAAAANPQWGANSATPIAYTHNLAPSSRAGTDTDVAGANATIRPGNGTGTGGSGSITFQTAPAAGSGNGANTMATVMDIGKTGLVTFYGTSAQVPTVVGSQLTAATMTWNTGGRVSSGWSKYSWTNAMVTGLGAVLAGDVKVCTLPAKVVVKNMYLVINTSGAVVDTLTVAVGRTGATYIDYLTAQDAKAAANTVYGDAAAERGTNLTGYDLPSFTGTTDVYAHFIATSGSGKTLADVTGSTGTIYIETATLS